MITEKDIADAKVKGGLRLDKSSSTRSTLAYGVAKVCAARWSHAAKALSQAEIERLVAVWVAP